MTKPPLPSFQAYQLAFTQHLRAPNLYPRPDGVKKSRMVVYQEIVFNNLVQSVSACFPVAKNVVGDRKWQKLIRLFFQHYSTNTPFFRDIPEEFLCFLKEMNKNSALKLPEFLYALCHYEWIELALSTQSSTQAATIKIESIANDEDYLKKLVFQKPLALLSYEYAVHTISKQKQPKAPESTQLLVYRDEHFKVQFIVLNLVTYELMRLLYEDNLTGQEALTTIANALNPDNLKEIIQFGLMILKDFHEQGFIVGYIA
jgi:uncharacterized protein